MYVENAPLSVAVDTWTSTATELTPIKFFLSKLNTCRDGPVKTSGTRQG